jgi:hypothetical protein
MAVEERNVKDVDQEMLKRNLVRLFLEKLKVTNEYKVQTLLEENALVVRDLKHMNEALVADDADSRSLSRKRKYEDLEDDDDNAEAASVTACTTSPLPKAM